MALLVAHPLASRPGAAAGGVRVPGEAIVTDDTVRVAREAVVMATEARIVVEAVSRPEALAASEAALAALEGADALLSTWDPASPLSRLNRAPVGEAVAVPSALLALLGEVEGWARETGRAFEPAVGALVDAWGLRTGGRVPAVADLERARVAVGPGLLSLDPGGGRAVRLLDGGWVDAGAFGKGAALRSALASVRDGSGRGVTAAAIDLGGQLVLTGEGDAGARGWFVDVAHPLRRAEAVARLAVAEASVATSGASERPGHLLDARTGRPIPVWGSVTVVTADALAADVLATALYVLGPDDGMAWLAGRSDIGALFLVAEGGRLEARWNAAMSRWLVEPPTHSTPSSQP